MAIIRRLADRDYPAVAAVMAGTLLNGETVTAEQIRYGDANRSPAMKTARWVAEYDGRLVGTASQLQYEDMYHPRKFWVMVRVHPDHQQQGVGAALYDALLTHVQQFDPLALQVQIREDQAAALAFAAKRGFAEYSRRWESYLDVAGFDPAPYATLEARLADEGITVKSVTELAADPDRDHKLHELLTLLDQDVPIDEPATPMSFESFLRQALHNPRFVADGTFIALDSSRYVAMSSFYRNGDCELDIDMTGTLRDYRRRGIGTLLKVRGIQFAQANGYERIVVTNDLTNTGMLAINAQLGYVRRPAQLRLAKTFAPNSHR